MYEEILDTLTEDEKATDTTNEAGDSFAIKNIAKKIKELKGSDSKEDIEFVDKLKKVEDISKKEKNLKQSIKKQKELLEIESKKQ